MTGLWNRIKAMFRQAPASPAVPPTTATVTTATGGHMTMPEASWFWRRIFIWALTLFISVLMWRAVDRLADIAIVAPAIGIPAFVTVLRLLLIGQIVYGLTYLVGPAAEHIVQIVQSARAFSAGSVVQSVVAPPPAAPVPTPDAGPPPVTAAPWEPPR